MTRICFVNRATVRSVRGPPRCSTPRRSPPGTRSVTGDRWVGTQTNKNNSISKNIKHTENDENRLQIQFGCNLASQRTCSQVLVLGLFPLPPREISQPNRRAQGRGLPMWPNHGSSGGQAEETGLDARTICGCEVRCVRQ